MKYRKKPVVIEAIQLKVDNFDVVCDFMGGTPVPKHNPDFGVDEHGNTNEPYLGVYIETLEGKMLANYGDYIIKGVNGEFYPCKPDIFEKTYNEVDSPTSMGFGDAIEVLKQGGAVRRSGWNGKGLFVIKQVPAHIESDIIPKMQSLPQSAKDLILKGKGFIDYTSQCLIYNENTGRADSWVPSISDVFAEDWEIVECCRMIVTTDIGNILYRDCKAFGIDIVPDGETLTGELKSERIAIHAKKQQPGTYWKKSFAEVNLCVPDLSESEANTIRLNEFERQANKLFDDVVSIYDGTTYRYSIESIGTEADTALKCHYVNVRILFEVLNVKL